MPYIANKFGSRNQQILPGHCATARFKSLWLLIHMQLAILPKQLAGAGFHLQWFQQHPSPQQHVLFCPALVPSGQLSPFGV